MLAGRRTFSGESPVEVMNAILKEDPPDLSETNARFNPALVKIVRRCLEKNRSFGFRDLPPVRAIGSASSYAAPAAGDRFLFVTAREEAASLQFTVVVNWAAGAPR